MCCALPAHGQNADPVKVVQQLAADVVPQQFLELLYLVLVSGGGEERHDLILDCVDCLGAWTLSKQISMTTKQNGKSAIYHNDQTQLL